MNVTGTDFVCIPTQDFETADGLVFVDPLEPPADLGAPDHVLLTIYWHGRSAADLGAAHVWSSKRAARPLANQDAIGV